MSVEDKRSTITYDLDTDLRLEKTNICIQINNIYVFLSFCTATPIALRVFKFNPDLELGYRQ